MPKDESVTYRIREFSLDQIPPSATVITLGPPGSGKTNLIEAIAYYKKDKYPVARLFMGSETGYNRFKNIFPSLYVERGYKQEGNDKYIRRQQKMVLKYPKKLDKPEKPWPDVCMAMNILDDASDDLRTFRHPNFVSMFKKGSQHWASLTVVGTQLVMDFDIQIRSTVSFVMIGKYINIEDKKKLFKFYGGNFGSQEKFNAILDTITSQKYTFMVIQILGTSSDNIEDTVFYWKPPFMEKKKWKFGCDAYKKWGKRRINPNYIENVF